MLGNISRRLWSIAAPSAGLVSTPLGVIYAVSLNSTAPEGTLVAEVDGLAAGETITISPNDGLLTVSNNKIVRGGSVSLSGSANYTVTTSYGKAIEFVVFTVDAETTPVALLNADNTVLTDVDGSPMSEAA